jgi:integrase
MLYLGRSVSTKFAEPLLNREGCLPMIARADNLSALGRKADQVETFTETNVPLFPPPVSGRKTIYDRKTEGLALVVTPTGHRSWYLFRRIPKGAFEKIHLGAYPAVRVEDARKAARVKMGAIAQGANPADERRADRAEREANARTFADWFEEYLDAPKSPRRGGGPKAESTKADFRKIVDNHLADWKARAIGSITRAEVEAAFQRIGAKAPVQANRMLAMVHATYKLASKRDGFAGVNPASGIDKNLETPRSRIIDPDRELGDTMDALNSDRCPIQRNAALFALQTGMRSGDVCKAEWQHINAERRTWTIPELSKRGIRHVVTLNDEALAVLSARAAHRAEMLAALEEERAKCEAIVSANPDRKYARQRRRLAMIPGEIETLRRFLFPSPDREARSRGMHLGSLRNVLDRIEEATGIDDLRPHDLRRTFGSYAHGAGIPKAHVGAALGHAKGSAATDVYVHSWEAATARVGDAAATIMRKARGNA